MAGGDAGRLPLRQGGRDRRGTLSRRALSLSKGPFGTRRSPAAPLSEAAVGPADAEDPLRPVLAVDLRPARRALVHLQGLLEPLLRARGEGGRF